MTVAPIRAREEESRAKAAPAPEAQILPRLGPGCPFLCFAGLDWWYHNHAHSDFQLMLRIAQQRKVLLINSLGMRMPRPGKTSKSFRRILRKLRSIGRGLRRPIPELPEFRVLSPLVLPAYGSRRGRRWSARLVRSQVLAAMRRCRIEAPHVIVTVPTAVDVALALPERSSLIYNRSDKHSAFEESQQGVIRGLEEKLFTHADRVLYASRELMSQEEQTLGGRAVHLDHGVDLASFTRATEEEIPACIRELPHPRIGWFGTLRESVVDFVLLERIARELPHAQLVLVGDVTAELGDWAGLPNVHLLGKQPHQCIPVLGSGFDVGIMPWLQNEWVRSANPIKLKEYLALGLPIVSMQFPEAEHYSQFLSLANDHASFIAALRRTLEAEQATDPGKQRAAVAHCDWVHRAADLATICDRISEGKG